MTLNRSELVDLMERLTRLTEANKITWERSSVDVLQYATVDFMMVLARNEGESYQLSVYSQDIPEGEVSSSDNSDSENARMRRDLSYLFEIAARTSKSATAEKLRSQLPAEDSDGR